MARLPVPGGDEGDWGTILNTFLSQSHNTDGSLKADSVGPSQLQAAALENTVGAGSIVFSVKDYGATGNYSTGTTGTDDTLAINNTLSAAAAAAASGASAARVLFPWTTGNGYKTMSGISVPAGVELDMRAPIVYCGTGGEAALTIGGSSWQARRHHRIMVRRYTITNWSSEADCGVIIRNHYASQFDIVQCDNFTVGLTCIGDTNNGFSYNHVNLGQIVDNKIAIDLTNDTGGWCNENDFYGGRITVSSTTNTSLMRYGVRVTSRATTKYYNNANVFHKPSFELKGQTTAGSRCALIEYATAQRFESCRHESNSPEVLEQLNNSHSNEMTFTYADLGAAAPVAVNSSTSSSYKIRKMYTAMVDDATRVIYKADSLHKKACYYDGSSAVNVPGLVSCTSGTTLIEARAQTGLTINADYLEIPSSRCFGFYMSTRNIKRFAIYRDVEASFPGRIIVRCYDSSGTVLTDPTTIRSTIPASPFGYITSYGGVFRNGSDGADPRDILVSDTTDYVFIGVAGGTAACRIRSLSVATQESGDVATWLTLPDNGINYATTPPTAGTWAVGRQLINAAPASGSPAHWVCSVAGTPGTWVPVYAGPAPANAPDVQEFTTSGTWTKPSGATTVEIICIGAGSGGGSGRRGAAGTVRGGGGGGAGGSMTRMTVLAADIASTATVTIGAGGAGGAAVTTDDTNGNAGSAGGMTKFFASPFGVTALSNSTLTGGQGGTTAGGAGGVSPVTLAAANTQLSAGASGGAGAAGNGVNGALFGPAGAGGGGGISAADVAFAGGGGSTSLLGGAAAAGTGGVVDGALPTAGTASSVRGTPGQSAGGGAASITTAAQSGATATGYGAGGGGGGASVNGNSSGAGGSGGPGYCLVITRF